MKIIQDGDTLRVSEIEELASSNSRDFQSAINSALPPEFRELEIDLSRTGYLDCGGIGALIAVGKRARGCHATVRLRNSPPMARRLFQLTCLPELFPVESEK